MSKSPAHLAWLQDSRKVVKTADGKNVKIFEFEHHNDPKILSAWAKHFRSHYCEDDDIDDLRSGTGKTRCDYLKDIKFPDEKQKPGPSVRAGDFGEILIADYVEFVLNYVVPRVRYINKSRDESKKGTDVTGFRQINPKQHSNRDELITFEVKCALVGSGSKTFKLALKHSYKDFHLRKAESLNAIKQRLKESPKKKDTTIALVERFQNKQDRPYKETSGAAAIYSKNTYSADAVTTADASPHPNSQNLFLIVIRGEELMKLVHKLYRIAANEA